MRFMLCALGAVFVAACNPSAETDNPAIATDNAVAERATTAPSAGANSFTEGQARDRIIAAGYTNPTALTQTVEGVWTGQATQGDQTVMVMVDYQGNVTPQSGSGDMPMTGTTAPMQP
jgi:hypothetical protein